MVVIKPQKKAYSHTNICLAIMFEAFQNNGRPWERIQQAKTHDGDAWPYCFLVLDNISCSEKSGVVT